MNKLIVNMLPVLHDIVLGVLYGVVFGGICGLILGPFIITLIVLFDFLFMTNFASMINCNLIVIISLRITIYIGIIYFFCLFRK